MSAWTIASLVFMIGGGLWIARGLDKSRHSLTDTTRWGFILVAYVIALASYGMLQAFSDDAVRVVITR